MEEDLLQLRAAEPFGAGQQFDVVVAEWTELATDTGPPAREMFEAFVEAFKLTLKFEENSEEAGDGVRIVLAVGLGPEPFPDLGIDALELIFIEKTVVNGPEIQIEIEFERGLIDVKAMEGAP